MNFRWEIIKYFEEECYKFCIDLFGATKKQLLELICEFADKNLL